VGVNPKVVAEEEEGLRLRWSSEFVRRKKKKEDGECK
jgi:hypothetical protein